MEVEQRGRERSRAWRMEGKQGTGGEEAKESEQSGGEGQM
jgi:hypothetical protein